MIEGSAAIAFYIISFVILLAAIGVVTLKNIFHAALSLIITLFAIAGLYILLSAEFLAAVQVLIYVGAIAILMIFAVMLTAQLTNYNIRQTNEQRFPALLISLCFIIVVITAIASNLKVGGFPVKENIEVAGSNTAALGHLLMNDFLLPFEVVSVLLLASLIGAIVLAKKDD